MTSRIYEHNADVCNFPGMSGNYAHAHAIFTRRYFSLDQRLGTRLTAMHDFMRRPVMYHTYGSRCIQGLARVLSIKPVHLKFSIFTFTMEAI